MSQQHTQKRQQAELDLELDSREWWLHGWCSTCGNAAIDCACFCPTYDEEPMTCDCDLHK